MSVAWPESVSEANAVVSWKFYARATVSGEDSDMNVQATGGALDIKPVIEEIVAG